MSSKRRLFLVGGSIAAAAQALLLKPVFAEAKGVGKKEIVKKEEVTPPEDLMREHGGP